MTRRRVSRLLPFALARAFALGVFALGSAACAGSSDSAAKEASADAAPSAGELGDTSGQTAAPEAWAVAEVELQVTGGAHAGRYAPSVASGLCSYGVLGELGMWGISLLAVEEVPEVDPKTFSRIVLAVSTSQGAADDTEIRAFFGPLVGGGTTTYDIDTGEKNGEGTVRVDDRGPSATLTFDGKTKDGVGLKGTVTCNMIMRGS